MIMEPLKDIKIYDYRNSLNNNESKLNLVP